MNESDIALLDGSFVKINQAAVPLISRGLMYGDGCFETLCAYSGRLFKLTEHLNRLKRGLNYLQISSPSELNAQKIRSIVHQLLKKNNLLETDAIIRLQVWRDGDRGYATDSTAAHYSVHCSPRKKITGKSCTLATVHIKRIPARSLPAKFKFSNGLNYITAAQEAQKKNADDALMQTIDGWVSETTIANIFWKKNTTIFTPSKECDILPGITRKIIMNIISSDIGMELQEGNYESNAIKEADTVWVCNSVKEIMPVRRLNKISFPFETPFLTELQNRFTMYVNQQLSKEVK